jgi:hypothetical protein
MLGCAEQGTEAELARDGGSTLAPEDATLALDATSEAASVAWDSEVALDAAGDVVTPSDMSLPPEAGSASAAPRTSLVAHESWRILDAGEDPFEDRPAVVECLTAGVVAESLSEERVLGVETGWCGYLTATQPARREALAGEVLKVRLWHFELSAPESAEAHAVVMVDGLRALDERVPIPGPGGLIVRELRLTRAIPVGAPVYFHLHNHGANSWALVEISAGL